MLNPSNPVNQEVVEPQSILPESYSSLQFQHPGKSQTLSPHLPGPVALLLPVAPLDRWYLRQHVSTSLSVDVDYQTYISSLFYKVGLPRIIVGVGYILRTRRTHHIQLHHHNTSKSSPADSGSSHPTCNNHSHDHVPQ